MLAPRSGPSPRQYHLLDASSLLLHLEFVQHCLALAAGLGASRVAKSLARRSYGLLTRVFLAKLPFQGGWLSTKCDTSVHIFCCTLCVCIYSYIYIYIYIHLYYIYIYIYIFLSRKIDVVCVCVWVVVTPKPRQNDGSWFFST